MSAVERVTKTDTVAITNDISTCQPIVMDNSTALGILVPTGVTGLTAYTCETKTGTYKIIDNYGTNGAVTVAADKWYTADVSKLFPYDFVKFLANAAGGTTTVKKKG